jgi:hypothetical protein
MAAVRWHWEVELGGDLRLQRRHWAAVAAEEHAMMASATALLKPKGNYYKVGVSVGKDNKREHIQCKGRTSTAMARK